MKKSSSKTPISKPQKPPTKKAASSTVKSRDVKRASIRIPKAIRDKMEDLKNRLAEAEETLEAIRSGGVDAVLVGNTSGGDRIYTLQGAEEPYRVFFGAMNEGAVTMTLDGTILYCNYAFADLAKVPLEKVMGMSFLDFISEDSRQIVAGLLLETGPKSRAIEGSLVVSGNGVVPVNISMNPLKTKDMEAVCAIVVDLSELMVMRKLEEVNKELQASERQLKDSRRAALNLMEDAVAAQKQTIEANVELQRSQEDLKQAQAVGRNGSWRLDVQRNVLIWSDENYRIFGIPKGTLLTYEIFLSTVHPDDREYVDTQWKAGLRGEPYDIEHRIMADGHVKWVREKAYLEFDHDNKLIGGFGITQDITERKQAEQDLLKLNEDMAARGLELERLNQELETFNYSVSHDLRAPLRSIEGFSRALGADHVDRLDAEGRDYLERVITAAHKMGRLITDLLNLSRISQEKIRRDRVDLSGMAVRIAEELKQEHPERNATFIICEGLSACGDERLLNIALENLIVNALKFTKNRSEAAIEFGITDGADGLAYFVKDNGVGFDMTYADKLFAPFQRLHADTEFPGTGIGLATVKRIINRHGGTVWIEGVKGKGTTAYFTLP